MRNIYTVLFLLVFTVGGHTIFGQCAVTLTITSINSSCSSCNNGSATATASGGTAPYTYVWTNNTASGTVNINPVRDNSIYEENPSNSNGAGESLVAGMTNAGFRNRALMVFDIAANVPTGASVTGSSLLLTVTHTSGASGPQAHTLYKVLENWGEGTSFNNSQPGQGAPAATNDATWLKTFFPISDWLDIGGTFSSTGTAGTVVNNPGSYTWSSPEMTQDIQSWYTNPSSNYGWLLKSDETGNRQAKRYGSRQNPVAGNPPLLTINYGPAIIGTTPSVSNLSPGTYHVTVTDALGCTAMASVTIIVAGTLPNIIEASTPGVSGGVYQLSSGTTYLIDGKVYVQGGVTLAIDEGVTIKGVKKVGAANSSALIITRGGRIEANGSITAPIIFTSNEPTPAIGDWGGIVILGSAPLNRADTSIEGIDLPSLPAGVDVNYGGGGAGLGNPNEDKGVMKYVRIEYAGAAVSANNELNSLTMGGVGRGTLLDYIEASWGQDDGFEWFGGTVNAKHLIALASDDDSWDADFGFSGNLQYCVSVLRSAKAAYSSNPRGIESSNDPTSSGSAPRTHMLISNMTTIGLEDSTTAGVLGKRLNESATFNTASSLTVRNSIFMGFPQGVLFSSALSIADTGRFQYNIVHAFRVMSSHPLNGNNTTFLGNVTAANSQVQLSNPFDVTNPNFRPLGSSPAVSGANFSGIVTTPAGFFLDQFGNLPTYRGAFAPGTSNWAATWTRFF